MKVSTVLTIIVFLITLLGSIGATSYYYTQSNKAMTVQVYEHLESIAQSRAHHIETFLENKKILAENMALIEKIEQTLLEPSDANLLAVNERLQKTVDFIDSILSMGLSDKNGILIASTTSELIGTDYSNIDYFQKTKKETSFEIIESSGKAPFFGVGAPINDPKTGEFLGMIGININLKELNKITLDKTGIGDSGETYLINKDNYAVTPLLFVEYGFLEEKINTINSRECGEDEEEMNGTNTFLDYRGEKVIGTHVYIPEIQWCLLAEIDEAEILGAQRAIFQRVALIIIISLVVIVTLIGFVVGKFLDKKIVLKKGNKRF